MTLLKSPGRTLPSASRPVDPAKTAVGAASIDKVSPLRLGEAYIDPIAGKASCQAKIPRKGIVVCCTLVKAKILWFCGKTTGRLGARTICQPLCYPQTLILISLTLISLGLVVRIAWVPARPIAIVGF